MFSLVIYFILTISSVWGFPGGSVVKNPPASVGDTADVGAICGTGISLEEGNGNPLQHLAWEIPWTQEPGGLQSMGSQKT